MTAPYIFIFTGTSGSGRKTVAHRLGRELGLTHVFSCTDRPPRRLEPPDRDYHFLSTAQFDAVERDGRFVESVRIDQYRYGIAALELEQALATGKSLYMVLNREGTDVIKQLYGDRVFRIFIYVDKQTVRERLESKGTAYDVIESYLNHYSEEVAYRKHCEHVVENVLVERTTASIKTRLVELLTK